MKRLHFPVAALCVLLLAGCSKAFDYLRDHPGTDEAKLCQISQLQIVEQNYPYSDSLHAVVNISSDADGNPVDMLYSADITYPQNIDNHFRYDKKGRLTDWLQNYIGEGGAVIWHRFSYSAKDHVVDSFHAYGPGNLLTDPNPSPESFERLFIYKLDAQGRVIKVIEGSDTLSYSYDHNGDLIVPGVAYDTKTNPYQTNTTWMFIFQDYSVHNPLIDDFGGSISGSPITYLDYNAYGLPQHFVAPGGYRFGNSYQQMTIVYACDLKAPALTGK